MEDGGNDLRRRMTRNTTTEFAGCQFHDDQSEIVQSYSMSPEEIDRILRKLKKNSDERHVLRYLAKVSEWSEKREDCYLLLREAGIVCVLLQVIQRYIYDVRIQERSLFSLKYLSENREMCLDLVSEQGLSIVLASMREHPRVAKIQSLGARILSHAGPMENGGLIASAGGFGTIILAMKQHEYNLQIGRAHV